MLIHGPAEHGSRSPQRLPAAEIIPPALEVPRDTSGDLYAWPTGLTEASPAHNIATVDSVEPVRTTRKTASVLRNFAKALCITMTVGTPVTGGLIYGADAVRDKLSTCEAVEPRYLAAAGALLELPDNPALVEAHHTNEMKNIHEKPTAGQQQENALRMFGVQAEVAAKHNLTVRSHLPEAAKLEADLLGITPGTVGKRPQTAVPTTEYIASAQRFLAPYNIGLRLAASNDEMSYGFRQPQAAELQSTTTKLSILNIMRFVSSQPAEYLAAGTTSEYIIAAGDPIPNPDNPQSGVQVEIPAYKRSLEQKSPVVINIKHATTVDTLAHEEAHGHDIVECDGAVEMNNDPHFEALNGGHEYTGDRTKTNGSMSYEALLRQRAEIDRQLASVGNQLSTATRANLAASSQELEKQADNTVYATSYAESDITEDKGDTAPMFTTINNPSYNEIIRLDCTLRQKMTYLMARAMQHSEVGKRTMQYFTDLNMRHHQW